jgi:RHH-type rel operon transcriptional repressor/antitoxin RelB
MPVVSVRVSDEQATLLDTLAKATDRTRSYLVGLAVEQLIEENEWQLRDIKQAIEEADRGEFATEEDVQAVRRKWLA